MFTRRGIAFILAGIAGIGLIWLILPSHAPEPSYNGKKLSQWLETSCSKNREVAGPAVKAICEMGTNALPFLVEWAQYRMPRTKYLFLRTIEPVARIFKVDVSSPDTDKQLRAIAALRTFPKIATEIKAAVPALGKIYRDPKTDPQLLPLVINALNEIHQNHPDEAMRLQAGEYLGPP